MGLDLDSAWQKYNRAVEHLKAIYAEYDALVVKAQLKPGRAHKYRNPKDRRCWIFEAEGLLTFDRRFAPILGDFVQDMRAALDHLAWALVHDGACPHPKHPKKVQFPIETTGTTTDDRGRTRSWPSRIKQMERLPGVGRHHIAIIRSYQPYHRLQRNKSLGRLAKLSNDDKHRVLTPVNMNSADFSARKVQVVNGAMTSWVTKIAMGRPVENGAELLRIYVDSPQADVDVDTNLTTYISLEDGTRLLPELDRIGRLVAEILGKFGPVPSWANLPPPRVE